MTRGGRPRSRPRSATVSLVASLWMVACTCGTATAGNGRTLSDEHSYTRWAHPATTDVIRRAPDPSARVVGRLHPYTEDGYDEVYPVLRSRRDRQDRAWLEIRLPSRATGSTGWVPTTALGRLRLTHTAIEVDRRRLRMYVFAGGRRIWSAPVGIGKQSTPTPAGHFWIRERIVIADRRSGYWPYAFGTSAYSRLTDWPGGGVVAIHGPYGDPRAIPGRISHGCIRVRPEDDAWLGHHVHVGTPLLVR